jgi:hypothetical protein
MNEGCNSAPSFVALAYLAYQLLSNTELVLLAILIIVIDVLRNKTYFIASWLCEVRLIKNLHIINEILRFDLKSIFDKACARQKRIINS